MKAILLTLATAFSISSTLLGQITHRVGSSETFTTITQALEFDDVNNGDIIYLVDATHTE
ncbi:hypothetical protein [Carboxylicivirga sp. M1479]|uniref:hypothetical protein n=1 Tax=Carboxylicivirga sp. M1479 TaxID=2594476 RepID=UPI00117781B6|nr:hypothetical protein [Carboxylicivirga sp. M1479]TRX65853.1 hypothetical protein FNN09_17270 [Carboxylicivirga sp. M1479]